MRHISSSITRPSDTTAYAAGDNINSSDSAAVTPTLTGVLSKGVRSGKIRELILIDDANVTTKLQAELWVFRSAPTLSVDNAASSITDADLADLVCAISIGTPLVSNAGSNADGNCVYYLKDLEIPFVCEDTSRNLYWTLIARNAYAPISGEIFTLIAKIDEG